jgi:hypothetical protein
MQSEDFRLRTLHNNDVPLKLLHRTLLFMLQLPEQQQHTIKKREE